MFTLILITKWHDMTTAWSKSEHLEEDISQNIWINLVLLVHTSGSQEVNISNSFKIIIFPLLLQM